VPLTSNLILISLLPLDIIFATATSDRRPRLHPQVARGPGRLMRKHDQSNMTDLVAPAAKSRSKRKRLAEAILRDSAERAARKVRPTPAKVERVEFDPFKVATIPVIGRIPKCKGARPAGGSIAAAVNGSRVVALAIAPKSGRR
jgi:hypothetical protein